mmetsp:Transcript_14744/g.30232  ORF Transcript_14744/g.30232 Transcript_14744/m.30232 type:complete len:243 (-) Transcript_14744:365-1093(-)
MDDSSQSCERDQKFLLNRTAGLGDLIKHSAKANHKHNAHYIHTKLVRAPSHLIQFVLHLCIDIFDVLIDVVDFVGNPFKHLILTPDLLSLDLGDFGKVLYSLPQLVKLSVEVLVAVLQHLQLLLLLTSDCDGRTGIVPPSAFPPSSAFIGSEQVIGIQTRQRGCVESSGNITPAPGVTLHLRLLDFFNLCLQAINQSFLNFQFLLREFALPFLRLVLVQRVQFLPFLLGLPDLLAHLRLGCN